MKTHPSRGSAKHKSSLLLNNSEADIAGEIAGWRGDDDLACSGTGGDNGGHVGVVHNGETSRGDAVECDFGRAAEPLPENLRSMTDLAGRTHECDKRRGARKL